MTPKLRQRRADEIMAMLVSALESHRQDMHKASYRPCSTCKKSANALDWAKRYRQSVEANPEGGD